jgi:hypothetical protein
MNLRKVSRYKLSLIGTSLLSIGLIVFMLVSGTSSAEAASKKPPTRTPTPTMIPTATATPQPTPTPGAGPHWQVVPTPDIGTASRLEDVTVVSANDIWAVGQAGESTLTLHWNGTQWSIVPSPNVTGNGVQNDLRGVYAVASNDIWAVGATSDLYNSPGWKTLTMHWNGSEWSIVPSPNLTELGTCNSLQAVAAISSNDVWAVGGIPQGYCGNEKAILMHWDGSAWTIVPAPAETALWYSSSRFGVAAVASNDVWTTGDRQPFHWDGSEWTVVAGAGDVLKASAAAANSVWTVGSYTYYDGYYTYGPFPEAFYWDGTQWRGTVPQSPTSNETFNGVVAIAANDVWAMGSSGKFTLTEHWDGANWSIVPSANGNPNPGSNLSVANVLVAADAVSSTNVWAVGYYVDNSAFLSHALILQYK